MGKVVLMAHLTSLFRIMRGGAADYPQAGSNHRIKKKVNNKQKILENNVKNKL